MKKSIPSVFGSIVTAIIVSVFFAGNAAAQAPAPVLGSITYQIFYDELSPYGTWIDYPNYGHVA